MHLMLQINGIDVQITGITGQTVDPWITVLKRFSIQRFSFSLPLPIIWQFGYDVLCV